MFDDWCIILVCFFDTKLNLAVTKLDQVSLYPLDCHQMTHVRSNTEVGHGHNCDVDIPYGNRNYPL